MLEERKLHSFHSGSVYFPPHVFRFLLALRPRHLWQEPVRPASQAQLFLSKALRSLAWPSWALSLQFVAGSYLGALSVGAPLVTLYGRIIKTHSKQYPGAQRANSMPGSTTSWTVKVICHMLLWCFNASSRVYWIDYSVGKGMRRSCTGLWADSDS